MTAKKIKPIGEKGVLQSEMEQLMTPKAINELKDLSPTLQQFLIRWQDKRDLILSDQLKIELKEFLHELYLKDNDALCKNVTNIVSKSLAETLAPMWTILEELRNGQKAIAEDVSDIKNRINVIEDRLLIDEKDIKDFNKRLNSNRLRIETFEKQIKTLQPELVQRLINEIHDFEPALIKLIKAQKWWSIGLRILIAVLISAIFTLIIHYNVPLKYTLNPEQKVEIVTK